MSYYTSAGFQMIEKADRNTALKATSLQVLAQIVAVIKCILMAPVKATKATGIFFIRWTLAIIFWGALIAIPLAIVSHFGIIALFLL